MRDKDMVYSIMGMHGWMEAVMSYQMALGIQGECHLKAIGHQKAHQGIRPYFDTSQTDKCASDLGHVILTGEIKHDLETPAHTIHFCE